MTSIFAEDNKTSNKLRIFDILSTITQEEHMETGPMSQLISSFFQALTSVNIHIYN